MAVTLAPLSRSSALPPCSADGSSGSPDAPQAASFADVLARIADPVGQEAPSTSGPASLQLTPSDGTTPLPVGVTPTLARANADTRAANAVPSEVARAARDRSDALAASQQASGVALLLLGALRPLDDPPTPVAQGDVVEGGVPETLPPSDVEAHWPSMGPSEFSSTAFASGLSAAGLVPTDAMVETGTSRALSPHPSDDVLGVHSDVGAANVPGDTAGARPPFLRAIARSAASASAALSARSLDQPRVDPPSTALDRLASAPRPALPPETVTGHESGGSPDAASLDRGPGAEDAATRADVPPPGAAQALAGAPKGQTPVVSSSEFPKAAGVQFPLVDVGPVAQRRAAGPGAAHGAVAATGLVLSSVTPQISGLGVAPGELQAPSPVMLDDLVPAGGTPIDRQIVQAMSVQWRDGVGQAHVTLKPDYLGDVSVALRLEQGGVVATLHADTPAVRAVLLANEAQLRQALDEQGLRLERLTITDERPSQDDASHDRRPPRDEPPVPLPRRLSSESFEVFA